MAEKLQALLCAYTNQQAENIALENEIAQASVSIEVKGSILKKKRDEVSIVKKELHEMRMHHTQMAETQKSFEAAISTEKREKNATYLEMVSSEHAVKTHQEDGKKIMMEHTNELNQIAKEYMESRKEFGSMFRQIGIIGDQEPCNKTPTVQHDETLPSDVSTDMTSETERDNTVHKFDITSRAMSGAPRISQQQKVGVQQQAASSLEVADEIEDEAATLSKSNKRGRYDGSNGSSDHE